MGNTTSGRRRVKVDEQYTRPQGLYPDRERDVDAKKLWRLILDGGWFWFIFGVISSESGAKTHSWWSVSEVSPTAKTKI
jgi:hypothetical protein